MHTRNTPRRSRSHVGALLLFAGLCQSCGWYGTGPITDEQLPTLREAQRPVTEVTQTVNLTSTEAYTLLLDILQNRGVSVASVNQAAGSITTDWVPMSDSLCGTYPSSRAPLPCKTRYTAEVTPISDVASTLRMRYVEECTERTQFTLECPGSNAERLMLSLIGEFKARAGVVDF